MVNYVSGDYRRIAKEKTRESMTNLVLIALIFAIITAVFGLIGQIGSRIEDVTNEAGDVIGTMRVVNPFFSSLSSVIDFVIASMFGLSFIMICKKLHAGEKVEIVDMFSCFKVAKNWCILLVDLVEGIFLVLWTLLFIIPGIIKAYAYAFTGFIWEENKDLGPTEAITESRRLMNGHKMDLFLLDLSYIGWILLSILTCGILFLWVLPKMRQAHYEFYINVTGKGDEKTEVLEAEPVVEEVKVD